MPSKRPDEPVLKELYLRWLFKKESLRSISVSVGVRHSTISTWFRKAYGKRCTSPKGNSLLRSLLEDYPDSQEVREWARNWHQLGIEEQQNFYSQHNLSQLSRYQWFRDDAAMEHFTPVSEKGEDEATNWEFLRLPLYLATLEYTRNSLLLLMFQHQLENMATKHYTQETF